MAHASFSVVVPVHNEANVLPATVPLLLDGLEAADVIFVCNGCTDTSRNVLERLVQGRARILDLPSPGKALAIRAAEEVTTVLPRFYVDADVKVHGGTLTALAERLSDEEWELLSPLISTDLSSSSLLARWVSEVWLALPYARTEGQGIMGVSRSGRARWGEFPNLLGDDAFITSRIPSERRHVTTEFTAEVGLPQTFWSWVGVRARWMRGDRELARLGLGSARKPGRLRALVGMLEASTVFPLATFVLARQLAQATLLIPRGSGRNWYVDQSSHGPRVRTGPDRKSVG